MPKQKAFIGIVFHNFGLGALVCSRPAASLTERDFAFDIDLDGHADQIAFVGTGSGFLALDRNGDGEINDGSELFGPESGDGFAELAAYDLNDTANHQLGEVRSI